MLIVYQIKEAEPLKVGYQHILGEVTFLYSGEVIQSLIVSLIEVSST